MNPYGTNKSIALLIGCLMIVAQSCRPANENEDRPLYGFETLNHLIEGAAMTPRFRNYQPHFHAEKRLFDFLGKAGPYQDSLWVIMDGDKYVALYFEQEKPYLDVFASNPEEAPRKLEMPVRHHNATLLGTRLTTSAWYDKWALSGDRHTLTFGPGGDSLTLTEAQFWEKDGLYKRDAASIHRFTFKVDPYLGYVVEAHCQLSTSDSSQQEIELMNFMPRDAVNPWPNEQYYTHTVFTPEETAGYVTYTNNMLAGNLADETKNDWGKGFTVRSGGFTGMFAPDRYSPVLFRSGNVRFVHRTCDAWLDLHQKILLPEADSLGMHHAEVTYLFGYLPPKLSRFVLSQAEPMTFKRARAVMIRLGILEDFEDQPLPIDHTGIGLTKGFWEKDFQIDSTDAYSGNKSLRMEGVSREALLDVKANFIRYPQVPLRPHTIYELSVMAKSSHPGCEGWIEGTIYEWTPYDSTRLARYRTPIVSGTEWQHLSFTLETPAFDPFIDLRFIAKGEGHILFDDLTFKPLSSPLTE